MHRKRGSRTKNNRNEVEGESTCSIAFPTAVKVGCMSVILGRLRNLGQGKSYLGRPSHTVF